MKRCRRRCPRQGCVVSPDYLVMIPSNLLRASLAQSPLDQAQTTISFLMEEIVRLSSKPSVEILNSVCKVGIGFCKKERLVKAKQSIAAADGVCSFLDVHFPKIKHLATGAVVDINTGAAAVPSNMDDLFGEDIFVVTCEHLIRNPQTKQLNIVIPVGMVPVFVIGDQDHWLYIADLVVQGSKYPNGRHKFATAVDSASTPHAQQKAGRDYPGDEEREHGGRGGLPAWQGSPPRAKGGRDNHNPQPPSVQFENMDLEALHLRTSSSPSPSAGAPMQPPLRSQTTSNLQETKSNTWNTKLLEKPPHAEAWDVAAFKIFCKIKPTSGKKLEFISPLKSCTSSNSSSCSPEEVVSSGKEGSAPAPALFLCPMFGATSLPEVEQTMRLISYQAMARSSSGSVSICWGRINQILNRQLLINFYSDYGSSGGAVIDRDGCLVGILSCSVLTLKQSAYIEPLYPLLHLLRSDIWRNTSSRCSL